MLRKVRRKEGENLDDATISKVVASLESDSPISKKEACELLNISYNTKRLSTIIDNWKEAQEHRKRRKAELRGTPLTKEEYAEIIQAYLSGEPVTEIEKFSYRSNALIKKALETYNIPERKRGKPNYFSPAMIPDEGIASDYEEGDLVYAARYDAPATVIKCLKTDPVHGKIYRVWIHGAYACFALQPYYELGDLRKAQKELNIKVDDISPEEIKRLLYESWLNSKKGKKSSD